MRRIVSPIFIADRKLSSQQSLSLFLGALGNRCPTFHIFPIPVIEYLVQQVMGERVLEILKTLSNSLTQDTRSVEIFLKNFFRTY